MDELEREIRTRLAAARERDADPYRVYAFYRDRPPAPALYVEVVPDPDEDRTVPVIAHNFRYYGLAMRRWDAGVVEALVLNELHELTHWAMTDEEREAFDAKSHERGLPDGYWLNRPLFGVIEWIGDGYPEVVDGRVRRLRRRLVWRARRLLALLRSD